MIKELNATRPPKFLILRLKMSTAPTFLCSASTGRFIASPGGKRSGTKHMWIPTLSPATPNAPFEIQPLKFIAIEGSTYIRILTPERTLALTCHPVGHNSLSVGGRPIACWTDYLPEEGHHAVWLPESVDGGTALRWYPLGDYHHHPEYRDRNLYLTISDTGELAMSTAPHVWTLL